MVSMSHIVQDQDDGDAAAVRHALCHKHEMQGVKPQFVSRFHAL